MNSTHRGAQGSGTLQGSRVLITGSNRGLGLALAEQSARAGAHVFAAVRDVAAAGRLRQRLADLGAQVELVALELTNPASIRDAGARLRSVTRELNVVINCAGVYLPQKPGEAVAWSAAEEVMRANAMGPVFLIDEVVQLLEAANWAHVLLISSDSANLDAMDGSDMFYRMSKAALNAAAVTLAMSLRPRRIRVSTIDPGWMRTDMGGPDATYEADFIARETLRYVEFARASASELSIWSGSKQPVAWTPMHNGREL